jgi:hypothetical protein
VGRRQELGYGLRALVQTEGLAGADGGIVGRVALTI